jgi:outer membrane receptor protein involved in Fe transport
MDTAARFGTARRAQAGAAARRRGRPRAARQLALAGCLAAALAGPAAAASPFIEAPGADLVAQQPAQPGAPEEPPPGPDPAPEPPEEPTRLDPIVVTPARIEQPAGEAPASVTVVTRQDVRTAPSQTVDDVLRLVPGFSLFRRSSSLASHPTTQGVSLRGIGPSGTSRALVLQDGVPVNDPFGGWVYWSRIPMQAVEQIEVVRGGGSSVWGNYALGGVIHVLTRRPVARGAWAEVSYGTQNTLNLDALLTEAQGPFRLSLEGSYFTTDGYPVVKESQRGAIDVDADSRHAAFNGRLEWAATPDLTLHLAGNYFDEDRGNGTPLQANDTRAGTVVVGGRLRLGDWGAVEAAAFGQFQSFHSTFTNQAPDRSSETLALDQTVPTTAAGGSAGWSGRLGDHRLSAGGDLRWIDGETEERVFAGGVFVRTRVAGGQQAVGGLYVQDVWTPHPAWDLSGGLRLDYWRAYDGARRDAPPPAGVLPSQRFPDREEVAVSPRVAAVYRPAPGTSLRASAYQGFRVPTLNELYRLFRVRNDVTAANASLEPERLTGGELGMVQRAGPVEARATAFWNDVRDLVANVTLAERLPDCPPGTTCRQRQNLDLARIRGFEAEVEVELARQWRILLGYLFTDAKVVNSPQQPALEGKRLAQVPRNSGSVSVRYLDPELIDATATLRVVGGQFEDDLNTLELGSFFVIDLFASRAIGRWGELFLAVENLLDTAYSVGRSTDGITSIGAPRTVRGGLRLAF